jgi:hypothetical protein
MVECPYCRTPLRESILEPHTCTSWEARQLALNPEGLARLCRTVGVSTTGTPYEIACRYLRWKKRNPQPRVSKR